MSHTTWTKWTCDRCGNTSETTPGEQPTDWVGLASVHPPRASMQDAERFHLCGGCEIDLGFFLTHADVVSS